MQLRGAQVVFLSLLAVCRAYAQGDDFVRQRDAEATANGSSGFSVKFADDRRVFHIGETIKLLFTFTRFDVSPFNYDHCRGLGLASAVFEHADGTADPQSDLWDNGVIRPMCDILSGIVGGVVGRPSPPIMFAVYLNQGVRFDRPGRYRFYVRSDHRIFDRKPGERRPPLVSNVLELEIIERDATWEARTFEQALGALDSSADAATRKHAARVVSDLGTMDAIREMADRFDAVPYSARGGDEVGAACDRYFLRGLYGATNRANVVAELGRQLDRPDRFISPRFVSQLAVLDLTQHVAVRPIPDAAYRMALRSYSKRRYLALKAAGRLESELERAFADAARHENRLDQTGLSPAYVDFPSEVEAALTSLAPTDQRKVLMRQRNWVVLHDLAFGPMLRRLARGKTRGGPQDVALRVLADIAPTDARALALEELANVESRMPAAGLEVLPDTMLAQYDDSLATALERASTVEEFVQAMDRVGRFASPRIFRRVRRVYEHFPSSRGCDAAPAALAYFFRAAPAYARVELGKVMEAVSRGETCEAGVLPEIARRLMLPTLEDAALRLLDGATGWMIADVSAMLRQYGTARAEAALWRAFERWRERWRGRTAKLEADLGKEGGVPWDEAVELQLAEALAAGKAWLMTGSSLARLTSLCLTGRCKETIEFSFRIHDVTPFIHIHAPDAPRGEPSFFVSDTTFGKARSREALRSWLLLHPPGTRFEWEDDRRGDEVAGLSDDLWLPGEADGYFEEVRTFAEQHGLKVIRRH